MDVLVTRILPGDAVERLADHCRVDQWREEYPIPRAELIRRIAGKDALLCLLTDPVDAGVLAAADRLKIISNYAVGYDNIDVPAADRKGIVVANTPGVLTEATADLDWALLFAVARRIVAADAFARQGRWQGWDPNLMLGADIFGQTLGVVGAGRIGTAFALRARGFDMEVLYADEGASPLLEKELGARRVDLAQLLTCSDFVSLHVPLNADTRHLLGPREFSRMKPTSILINTSRGAVIDEGALVNALQKGDIAGAGLDVFEQEPRIHPDLVQRPDVVILPHIASATFSTRKRMADLAVENILAWMRGEDPPHPVRPASVPG